MPVRWGRPGEKKTIKAYSNCAQAELFVDGVSQGMKRRRSQDFPCAGLRWDVELTAGAHRVHIIAERDGVTVQDEIGFIYQTEAWGRPAVLQLREVNRREETVTVEASVYDANGVFCPDAAEFVSFALAGDGKLLDNQGTAGGSRYRQLANGRAHISLRLKNGGVAMVSVSSEGIPTAFLRLE
ncbi:DUF4982 domain-containing protein [Paenibacillus sp. P26]|nr:DUF4982 domain-containing protein [Paenibacillus sp. P26]